MAIASYIARENKANLHGKTQEDHANVLRWMSCESRRGPYRKRIQA